MDDIAYESSSNRETAIQLANVLGLLRRGLRRRQREMFGDPGLHMPEGELLRVVRDHPDIRVGDAARALGIAPNTASTLIHKLVASGLVSRESDPRDKRVSKLSLSPEGEQWVRGMRDHRLTVLLRAMESMDPDKLPGLSQAVTLLSDLARAVEDLPLVWGKD